MRRCALVTGGSGFLGGYIVRDLLEEGFEQVVVLMRGKSGDDCARRLRTLWWERAELRDAVGNRVTVALDHACDNAASLREGLAEAYGEVCAKLDDMGDWFVREISSVEGYSPASAVSASPSLSLPSPMRACNART